MKINRFQAQLFWRVERYFASALIRGFLELLEKKHLYQNLRIELPEYDLVLKEMKHLIEGASPPIPALDETCEFVYSSFGEIEWKVINPREQMESGGYVTPSPGVEVNVFLEFIPSTVKLYCGVCSRIEPYNFQHGQDLLEEFRRSELFTIPENEQVFSFAYQCQSCKSPPEIFLIRRLRNKLTLNGRSPMEQIENPTYLPKEQGKFFSDSIIAFNSGQVLAGIFLLRTFVEQYVRGVSSDPNTQNIESLFLEYMTMLPEDFKQRFPSLQTIYNYLSEDIHGAEGSEDLYFRAKKDIEKHFNAKKLYEIR